MSLSVGEWVMCVPRCMNSKAPRRVRLNVQHNESGMRVGVHQRFVLSTPPFILVLEAFSCQFCPGAQWEFLYADGLALIADSLEECVLKLKAWKLAWKMKGPVST